MTQVQKIVAWVLAFLVFGLVIGITVGTLQHQLVTEPKPTTENSGIVPAQLGGYFEQTTVNAGKGVRFNDVATLEYVTWNVPAGTSTAAVQNVSGFDKFVDDINVVLVNPNAIKQMVDASSSMYYILATSSVATIADFTNPLIISSLIASATVATTGPEHIWGTQGMGKYLVFSDKGVSKTGVNQGGTTNTSNYASSSVLWRNGEYLILLVRPYSPICGGAVGSPNAGISGMNNYARSCESATSSTYIFTPKATIRVRTP